MQQGRLNPKYSNYRVFSVQHQAWKKILWILRPYHTTNQRRYLNMKDWNDEKNYEYTFNEGHAFINSDKVREILGSEVS